MMEVIPSWIVPEMEICKLWCHVICISPNMSLLLSSVPLTLMFSALQGDIIQEDNTQMQKTHSINNHMQYKTNAKLTTNAFPEISKPVWAEARSGRTLSLLTHAVGLKTREFVTQKWHLDIPSSPGVKYSRGGREHPQLQIYGRGKKDCTKPEESGIWDMFQATRVTKEIVCSIMIILCIFELSRGNCISTIYFAYCPHPTEFESAVLFSHKHRTKDRKKFCFHFIFHFRFFFRSLMNFNPHLVVHRKQTFE